MGKDTPFITRMVEDIEVSVHAQEQYYKRIKNKEGDPIKVIEEIEKNLRNNSYLAKYHNSFGFYNSKNNIFFPLRGEIYDKHIRTTLINVHQSDIEKVIAKLDKNLNGVKTDSIED